MELTRFCANVLVSEATKEESTWLINYLTLPPRKFSGPGPSYPTRLYFGGKEIRFGSGLLGSVLASAAKDGLIVNVTDARGNPPRKDPHGDTSWLRDYQKLAVHKAIEKGNGILWLPTGAGKTEIAVGLVNSIDCEWLFLVHRGTLVDQAAARYKKRTGRTAGRVKSGKWSGALRPERFTVATFQSVWRNRHKPEIKNMLRQVQGIIVDEAHTVGASSYQKVALSTVNAYYRIGLSGTPLQRTDDKTSFVIAVLGPPIYRISANALISRGAIVKPNIKMLKVTQTSAKRPTTYNKVYKSHVVNSNVRNAAVVNIVRNVAKPALVFVRALAHGKRIMDMLNSIGIDTELVSGKDFDTSRQSKIRRLETGKIVVLVTTVVFQEGIDIPELRSVVVASGGASGIATIQRVGRAMRVVDGKSFCTVWDIFDQGERWLSNQSYKRKKSYTAEGYEVKVLDSKVFSGKQQNLHII